MYERVSFIDGEHVPPAHDRWLPLIDPASGETVGRVGEASSDDVDRAYASSNTAFRAWSRRTPGDRARLLIRLADAIEAEADEIATLEIAETGKGRHILLQYEILPALDELRFFAGMARSLEGRSSAEYVEDHTSVIRREPLGVIGQIAPWNYPLGMAIWKFGPALAAGNTVVLKPSETTPSSALRMAELAAQILGPGVLNVVTGGRDTGRAVAAHPTAAMLSITGSTRAGQEVAAAAATSLARVHLELGGVGAAVIANDVDLDEALGTLVLSSFVNTGQDCTAITRLIVHESIYATFLERFVSEASKLALGAPQDHQALVGPVNNARQLAHITGMVDRVGPGARVLLGGHPADRPGYYYPPTVIADVEQRDEIVQEEVFGPVVTVQSYRDDDDALRLANGTRFGLAASIWTNDVRRAQRFTRELDAGTVWVNTHLTLAAEAPHGGFKASGYGKDLSHYAVEEYTRIKHVMTFSGGAKVAISDDGQLLVGNEPS